MRKFLTFIALALLMSAPALAESTITIGDGLDVKIEKKASTPPTGAKATRPWAGPTATTGAASGAAVKMTLAAPYKDGNPTAPPVVVWNATEGQLVRSVNTRQVGPNFASVFVAADGCELLFKLKYPFLTCPRP
jgi:hypothetical protein